MTPFEQQVEFWKHGTYNPPTVSTGRGDINYFEYALTVHIAQCRAMSKGLGFKGVKVSDFKKYYGLTGRTAKQMLPQLEQLKLNRIWTIK